MITTQGRHERILNKQEAWEAYLRTGSLTKAQKVIGVNPRTGNYFYLMAIARAAYQYALSQDRLNETRIEWERTMLSAGQDPTDEAWKKWVLEKAHVAYYYSPRQFEKLKKALS